MWILPRFLADVGMNSSQSEYRVDAGVAAGGNTAVTEQFHWYYRGCVRKYVCLKLKYNKVSYSK